jgi:hypothetical protein
MTSSSRHPATPGLLVTPRHRDVDASAITLDASSVSATAVVPARSSNGHATTSGSGGAAGSTSAVRKRDPASHPSASAAERVPGETRRELAARLDDAAEERREEESAESARRRRRQRCVEIVSHPDVPTDVREHFLGALDHEWVLELLEMFHDPILPRRHWLEWLHVAVREGERYPYVIRRMQARRFVGLKHELQHHS